MSEILVVFSLKDLLKESDNYTNERLVLFQGFLPGHSIEINAKGDITFTLSTGQIQLLSTCVQQTLIISKAAMISFPSQKSISGSSLDSGVDCGETSAQSNLQPANIQPSSNLMESQSMILKINFILF